MLNFMVVLRQNKRGLSQMQIADLHAFQRLYELKSIGLSGLAYAGSL